MLRKTVKDAIESGDANIVLNLSDFTSHTFADAHPQGGTAGPVKCTNCTDGLTDAPPISMKVRDMSQLMMMQSSVMAPNEKQQALQQRLRDITS